MRKLHNASLETAERLDLDAEIKAWQGRFYDARSWTAMSEWFSWDEMDILDRYMQKEMPARLKALGEELVLSHGDLGDGNIFVGPDGKVGVIDFNETCYLDEAADFMDVTSTELCEQMLEAYGADETLREKVRIRRELRPLIVFGGYVKRDDRKRLNEFAKQIRETFLK